MKTTIDNLYFHVPAGGALSTYRGQIVSQVEPGWYLVQFFDWLVGGPSHMAVIPLGAMCDWMFYACVDDWMKRRKQL